MDLSSYFTRLKTLWDDLESAECVKTCKNCSCCRAVAFKNENSRIVKFLSGLNDFYSGAKSEIIMKKQLPDLSGVYNLLDQDHNQRNLQQVHHPSIFNVTSSSGTQPAVNATNGNNKPRPVCTHSGYNGHTIEKCYKIYGYPPGFKHKQKNGSVKTTVSQVSLSTSVPAPVSLTNNLNTLSKDQIQGVIAYSNSQLEAHSSSNTDHPTIGGTISALPGSYQGSDDWGL